MKLPRSLSVSIGLGLVAALLILNAWLQYRNARQLREDARRVARSHEVLDALEGVLGAVRDAETGQRGYLLTGDPAFREPYDEARIAVGVRLERIVDLTREDPAQRPRIGPLRERVAVRLAAIEQTLRAYESRGFETARAVVRSGRGKAEMDALREQVAEMMRHERFQLARRAEAKERAYQRTILIGAALSMLGLATVGAFALLLRRHLAARHRAAAAIHEGRELLRTTLRSIGDAVIATDDRGRVTFLNPAAEAMTGWGEGEAAGRPMAEVVRIVHEETLQPVEDPVARVLRDGSAVVPADRIALIARDGTRRPIEDGTAPIRDSGGAIRGVVQVFRDVSVSREARRLLRESEDRYRTLIEVSPQIVWEARPDGALSYCNHQWCALSGLDPEQSAGDGWLQAVDPEHRGRVRAAWYDAVARGQDYTVEMPLLRAADGAARWHLARGLPLRDDRGRVVRWVNVALDVHEQKRAEQRTQAAREEAEEANRAKDQFLAVLSHELRTPLNPILLAVTSMLDRPFPPEEVRPTLEMIRQNVTLQARLIDDLLDVMRIVRGKMPLHGEAVDCHALIGRALAICQSEIQAKGLRVVTDLAAGRPFLHADPARLQQVLWNLLKNALKFTPGGGTVTIRTANPPTGPDDPTARIVVEVADTGIGISPETLGRIFDPFQQGEGSITRRYGGMGLGLAICRGIVEAHGGTLAAESDGPGRGATFRLTLHTLAGPVPATANDPAGADAPAEKPAPGAPLKILAVEDEPLTLALMVKLLRRLGHEVATAATAAEALDAAVADDFDVIVSDIGLPDGSGLDLMRQITARRGPVPSIALTGYGMEEDIRRSREAGFTAHLTKPIDFQELEAMLGRVARVVV